MDAAAPQRALAGDEAAQYVGLSRFTLEKYRSHGGGPTYIKLGKRVVYLVSDLDQWLASRRRTSTSDPGQGHQLSVSP